MSGISYDLEEKVVVVTGGSRGIGLELARHFLAAGRPGRHLRPEGGESRGRRGNAGRRRAAPGRSGPCRPGGGCGEPLRYGRPSIRRPRYPHQQRRDEPADGLRDRYGSRRLEQDHRGKPDRRLPLLAEGGPDHAGEEAGEDRQHLVACRDKGLAGDGDLRDRQGRCRDAHEGPGLRARPLQHPGQRRRPGGGADRFQQTLLVDAGHPRPDRQGDPGGPHRRDRRSGSHRPAAGLRSFGLHHRADDHGRRGGLRRYEPYGRHRYRLHHRQGRRPAGRRPSGNAGDLHRLQLRGGGTPRLRGTPRGAGTCGRGDRPDRRHGLRPEERDDRRQGRDRDHVPRRRGALTSTLPSGRSSTSAGRTARPSSWTKTAGSRTSR